jgi:branched-chain amino acid transport system substrate-binding protein
MKQIKFGICIILLACFVALPVIAGGTAEEKDKIVIGAARSLSGPLAVVEGAAFGPIFKMWVDEVNADGGIFVKEYNKKLPIETRIYDDKSDIGTMTRLLEKLIVEDKVDFVFPSDSTAMLFAAAPIANKYGYILMGMEGGATKIKEIISGLPYFFAVLSFSDHNQVPVLADLLEDWGVKSAAIAFIADLHGVEYSGVAVPELALKGIDIVMTKSVPPGIKDMSPLLKEAKAANVDAFLIFAYPDENILATKQSMELGFNPKVFLTGPGANFGFFPQIFGPAAEGIMSWGAWNRKSSPEHKELADKLAATYGEPIIDWWGHNLYWAGLQFWKQAVEKAGTLDQAKIRDIMETEKFDTILGPTWFDENHLLAVECHTGEVGQWQNGVFEVIGPPDKATADPIFPKPPWPQM